MEFDFIIVGAGTAGCVVARRLIEKTDARVLLVEAGPGYPAPLLDPPLPGMKFGRGYSWGQKSIPQPRLGGRTIEWPMGKVVGGTSSVNAMMGYLGNPANFDEWEASGNPGWSSHDLAPYFHRVFGTHPGESFQWQDGEILSLSEQRFRSPFSEAFLEACIQDGMRKETPLVGREDRRCGYFPVLQRNGARFESASGYLAPVKSHPRLSLETCMQVRRVLLEKNRAVGIEVEHARRSESYRATRGVVVCAGVFQTPRILQCSGIGPAKILQAAGILTVVDLPSVGENFQDHVRVGLLHRSGRVSPGSKRYWIPGMLRYLVRRDGVMSSNCCESGAFFCSRPGLRVPDIELITHFQTFGPKGEVDIEVCLVSPKSRGRVFIDPLNPFGMPLVDANFLADEDDVAALEAGIQHARSICARPTLRDFPLLKETSPGATARDGKALRKAIFQHATTAYHPCGSCAMRASGALGSDLRVLGTDSLWVADASAMPFAPTGNIVCSVIVLAEKASDLIARSAP
ncbi:MAG: hypothetical protein FGM15_11620 [Chthoniobacterales bacterium]|nr:hypothetical protein [Chthoniobacterales bacterium]